MHRLSLILSKKILYWYDNNKRILPWRIEKPKNKKQYYVLVSEFMLQQTQVKTVIPYFERFVKKISNLKSLSEASEKQVLKLWEGLGYYRRARNLSKTAKILVKKYRGKLPKKVNEIIKLPGVGEYTANSLSALVYNEPCIPIDGNVKRVFSRIFSIYPTDQNLNYKIKSISFKPNTFKRNAEFAEALMEFGALVCKPKNPLCTICSLKKYCKSFQKGNLIIKNKKLFIKEKKFNIYCYLNKGRKEIALGKNKNLGFLNNFKVPKIEIESKKNSFRKKRWKYLCNYKNNISNIKMNINLFYKFTKNKPKKFSWYSLKLRNSEFIPSFTKKIIKKVEKIYL